MSYYGIDYPEIGDVVFVRVNKFSEHGIYCNLIEYENKEGFLAFTELDKKVYYDRKKYFDAKKKYPMTVVRNDPSQETNDFEKDGINLSYKRFKQPEIDKYVEHFNYVSKMYRLTEDFSQNSGISLDLLLPLTMWKIMKKDGLEDSHKIFNSLLRKPDDFINESKKLYPSESDEYLDSLNSRITSTTVIIHQYFDLTVHSENAIQTIKSILNFDNIKIEYVNAPTYRIITECKFNDETNNLLDNCIEIHKQKITNKICSQCDLAELCNEIAITDINTCIETIKKRIDSEKDKSKILFKLGKKYLVRDREVTVKYLQKEGS